MLVAHGIVIVCKDALRHPAAKRDLFQLVLHLSKLADLGGNRDIPTWSRHGESRSIDTETIFVLAYLSLRKELFGQ
jgi:hypothetical protein